MRSEAYLKSELAHTDTVRYTDAAARVAGEVFHVANIGVMISTSGYGASAEGVYYTKGIFQFPITSGVTVSQGSKCYWDASANTVILSTSADLDTEAGDFYLGRALAAGSAAGGYADIEISNTKIDTTGLGRSVASAVIIENGLQTCVNVTLATNATLETILLTQVMTTDQAFVQFADTPDDTASRIISSKCIDSNVVVTLNTPAKASAPSARLAYQVIRPT